MHNGHAINFNVRPQPEQQAGRVRWKTIALPAEHGGWGLSLEPIVLGLLVAPSVAGFCLAVAALGAFLARHPFKLIANDWRRGRTFPRTVIARRFAAFYGAVAAFGLIGAIVSTEHSFLLPVLSAMPLAAVQLFYDASGRSRSLWPELAGSVTMAAVSSTIALAAGWPRPMALGLWAVLAARVIPTILYVRARLLLLHGKTATRLPVIIAHALALILAFALALGGVLPFLAVMMLGVLLVRALDGFIRQQPAAAKRIGLLELAFGALTVLTTAVGHFYGW